jgi:hypothetical protein
MVAISSVNVIFLKIYAGDWYFEEVSRNQLSLEFFCIDAAGILLEQQC